MSVEEFVPAGRAAPEEKTTKGKMQQSLTQLGIKFNRSATKEELVRLLSRATVLRRGATDMGSCFNAGGGLSFVMGNDAFWEGLGHWKWIGIMSMVHRPSFPPCPLTRRWGRAV
mmetsp:Transcript_13168/g.33169  ORF Transcript_13168/g.33169 Transcript_13168/m.33169 type:complete len:114 (+) Transcript_13168:90-431(+)